MTAVAVRDLRKHFGRKEALKGVTLSIQPGEMVALIGASGSGKSTLIRHIGGLERSDRADCSVAVFDRVIQADGRLVRDARMIRREIGVVFQQFNLVGRLSVLKNVLAGLLGRVPMTRGTLGFFSREERHAAMDALRRVGIADTSRKKVHRSLRVGWPLAAGQVDNASAIQAVDRANGEVFAQTVSVEGNPGYLGLLIVPIDSPLQTLEDALACDKSLNFGIGDPNSTSGYLVPMTFVFAARGINPADCFRTVRNANHETNALAVANGQVDIATNNTENMTRLQVTNPEAAARIRVLWQSPLIPSDPIVWYKELDQETKNALFRFFMSYGRVGTPEEVAAAREVLAALGWAPFRPSSDAQLYPVRIMSFTRAIFNAEADTTLTAEARAAQITELTTQRDAVQALLDTVPPL